MNRRRAIACAALVACAILVSSCQQGQNGVRGGDLERQLDEATVARDLDRVTQLLASGADPNKMGLYEGHYQSPWRLAAHQARPDRKNSIAIVRAMLASHANPAVAFGEASSRMGKNTYTVQVETPILEAVANSAPDVVRALLEAGLDLRRGQLALVLAVENGEVEIVHVLVDAGVNVNCRPSANTPLLAAIEARNADLMTYLEAHGAREKP